MVEAIAAPVPAAKTAFMRFPLSGLPKIVWSMCGVNAVLCIVADPTGGIGAVFNSGCGGEMFIGALYWYDCVVMSGLGGTGALRLYRQHKAIIAAKSNAPKIHPITIPAMRRLLASNCSTSKPDAGLVSPGKFRVCVDEVFKAASQNGPVHPSSHLHDTKGPFI